MHSATHAIHWNGGRPYTVEVHTRPLYDLIALRAGPSHTSPEGYTIQIFKSLETFIPEGETDSTVHGDIRPLPSVKGNTLLLCTEADPSSFIWKYVLISNEIYEFEIPEPIVRFRSPVGNSNVPYPFAVSQTGKVYLLGEQVVIPPTPEDPYSPYKHYYVQKGTNPNFWSQPLTTNQLYGRVC